MEALVEGLSRVLAKVFGSANERAVRRLWPTVRETEVLEPDVQKMTQEEMRQKTAELKKRFQDGDPLESLLPMAFALVRESSLRTTQMRHFPVQLLGGIVLHQGKIAEMATGEGKTLVATSSAVLNALTGRGVHIVTVNDYLARRDTQWMGPIYEYLGLVCGVIQHDYDEAYVFDPTYEPQPDNKMRCLRPVSRQDAYLADITYGTNNNFGFDYLRDNMKVRRADLVQREFHYAIVDEVDSILIDEARTPLIISGPAEESTEKYYVACRVAKPLSTGVHYEVKEKERQAILTEEGIEEAEKLVGAGSFYGSPENMEWPHLVETALRAKELYRHDREYVIKDGEVIIVDEFTGRMMPGRRWSDGLHQAVEAKEGLRIQQENQTLATITLQNYFKMYKKLAGMTGTAATEAHEFYKIYRLEVVSVPTNCSLIRHTYPDLVFGTLDEKFQAVREDIVRLHQTGRPILVGTTSIENTERLSQLLQQDGVPHEVLNAKYHEREAYIVAKAGQLGNVTIATNMAGRGTDILLGKFQSGPESLKQITDWLRGAFHVEVDPAELEGVGAQELPRTIASKLERMTARHREKPDTAAIEEALAKYRQGGVPLLGGLHILGTERHEARRIDNQLRGRAGRQGDPGSSQFFLSLEDDLMRIIMGAGWVRTMMTKLGLKDGQAIESGMVTRAIGRAQQKMEAHNFDIRKQLLDYDEVMNEQRKIVYGQRQEILRADNLREMVLDILEDRVLAAVEQYCPSGVQPAGWDLEGLVGWAKRKFGLSLPADEARKENAEEVAEVIYAKAEKTYEERERSVCLQPLRLAVQKFAVRPGHAAPDWLSLSDWVQNVLGVKVGAEEFARARDRSPEQVLYDGILASGNEKATRTLHAPIRLIEQRLLLDRLDQKWKDHLYDMDHLRAGIGLRGYAQVDPRVAYKREGYGMFQAMIESFKEQVTDLVLRVRFEEQGDARLARRWSAVDFIKQELGSFSSGPPPPASQDKAQGPTPSKPKPFVAPDKVGRNNPCPCGSGKKFKKCCGRSAEGAGKA